METIDFPVSSAVSGSVMEKGVLIHIVEDTSNPLASQEQPAVLISMPATGGSEAHLLEEFAVHDEIFSTARVTVSVRYLDCIPEDKETFFGNLCTSLGVKFDNDANNISLHGSWCKILHAQEAMKSYLSSWKQQRLAHIAYQTFSSSKEATNEETSVVSASPKSPTQENSLSVGSTRLRTRLHKRPPQVEKMHTRSRVTKATKPETCVATPRDNKENEVHVSISLASSAGSSLQPVTTEPQQLIVLPAVLPAGSAADTSPRKCKKNYEMLAPFKFFCNICSFKTKRESHYLKHLERHENSSNIYSCDTCNFRAIRLGHLRRHELTHSTSMLSCSLCHYRTDDERFLARHKRLKHPKDGQVEGKKKQETLEVLSCGACGYSTTKLYLFQRHLKAHGSSRPRRSTHSFQCEICHYKTNRKEHYWRHVNNVHQNRRPYLCDLCGKAFKRPDALKQHGITHAEMDPTVTIFRCAVCNKGCRSQAHLNEHLAVHSNVRAFLCEICGLSFKTRSVQRKHVLTIHKNPHAYSCHRCQRRFNTKYALRRHMKQHSWKEEQAEEDRRAAALINSASESQANTATLTVQVPEELLTSLTPGTVAVPLQYAVQVPKKDEGATVAEVLALQLPEQNAGDSTSFLAPTPAGGTPGLLYVATAAYEHF